MVYCLNNKTCAVTSSPRGVMFSVGAPSKLGAEKSVTLDELKKEKESWLSAFNSKIVATAL